MIQTSLGEKPLSVYSDSDFESLMNSTLLRDTLLLKIPENSRIHIMPHGEKLFLHTDQVDDMQMQDCEGEVIKKAKGAHVEIGDLVIFHYLSLNNGRDGTGVNVFTFAYKGSLYHLIPYNQIFFSIRNGEYICHNGKYLVESIPDDLENVEVGKGSVFAKKLLSGIVELKKDKYLPNKCKVVATPKDAKFEVGDIVVTFGCWDVPIKSDTMRKNEKQYFRCEDDNLVCKEEFIANV
jgi:hypothetical protein